jgi:Zn-dependent protease
MREGGREMGWSWKLGKLGGIEIKVHATFLLALAWGAVAWGGGKVSGLAYGAFLTLVLFSVVLLHELGHSLAARRYGIPVHDILLLPIGGVARLARMPEKPAEELVVALAGPAVNVAFVLLLVPLFLLGGSGLPVGDALSASSLASPSLAGFAGFLLMVNTSLLLFNLIPAFPLDGGRVLRAVLAFKLSSVQATDLAALIGRGLAIAIGLYGLVTFNFLLAVVALFIFAAAGAEAQDVRARDSLKGLRVTEVLESHPPLLTPDTPVHLAFERLARSRHPALAIVDQNGGFQGIVTAGGIQRRWREGVRGPLSAYIDEPGLTLDCTFALDVARHQMLERQTWVAPVYCGREFAGLLDFETIGQAISLRRMGKSAEPPSVGTAANA